MGKQGRAHWEGNIWGREEGEWIMSEGRTSQEQWIQRSGDAWEGQGAAKGGESAARVGQERRKKQWMKLERKCAGNSGSSDSSGNSKKWSHSRHMLKVKLTDSIWSRRESEASRITSRFWTEQLGKSRRETVWWLGWLEEIRSSVLDLLNLMSISHSSGDIEAAGYVSLEFWGEMQAEHSV